LNDATGNRSDVHSCNAEYIWTDLISKSPNVRVVLCGHDDQVDGKQYRVDNNVAGQPVHQILSDFQNHSSLSGVKGDGWLRIFRFVPAEDKVYVDTYSTFAHKYENEKIDRSLLVPGKNVLTIEVHNTTLDSSDLSMIPGLKARTYYASTDIMPVPVGIDQDKDGALAQDDCNDLNSSVYPSNTNIYCDCNSSLYGQGRSEICGNDVDENCDGVVESCTTAYANPQVIGTMPSALTECSGIVASSQYPGVYWINLDSGDQPRVYAVKDDGTLLRMFTVTGASATDWEDIAIDRATNELWVGDFGNNPTGSPAMPPRETLTLYKFKEPNPFTGETTTAAVTKYYFKYPDTRYDTEAFFIWNGKPYTVTKRTNADTAVNRLYELSTPLAAQTVTMTYLGNFNLGVQVTGADISSDGQRLTLISDGANKHWVYARATGSNSVGDFANSPALIKSVSFDNQQGEAIGFRLNSYDVLAASEQRTIWSIPQSRYQP